MLTWRHGPNSTKRVADKDGIHVYFCNIPRSLCWGSTSHAGRRSTSSPRFRVTFILVSAHARTCTSPMSAHDRSTMLTLCAADKQEYKWKVPFLSVTKAGAFLQNPWHLLHEHKTNETHAYTYTTIIVPSQYWIIAKQLQDLRFNIS